MANTAVIIAGATALAVSIYFLTRRVEKPSKHIDPTLPETPEEFVSRMDEIEAYFGQLKTRYADDPTLASHLNQALNSIRMVFEGGNDLNEDRGFIIFMQQLDGYVAYRATRGYITFEEFGG